jgi:hypothetical protein
MMKKLAMCFVPALFMVACGVEAPTVPERDPAASTAADSDPPTASESPELGFGLCGPGSQGVCAGQTVGTQCAVNPTGFCTPLVQGSSNVCRCAVFR